MIYVLIIAILVGTKLEPVQHINLGTIILFCNNYINYNVKLEVLEDISFAMLLITLYNNNYAIIM